MSKTFGMIGGGGGGIKLASISITKPPAKTTYMAGETFDPAGMVVTATYSNGATLACTGYSYEPNTPLDDGTTKVTIRYTEGGVTKTAEQSITVIHSLAKIEITAQPTKTNYEYGDSFQSNGMIVKATYSDGATANVTGYTCSPETLNTVGTQTITVSYTERGITKTTTLSVTVERKSIATVPSQSGTLTYTGSAQSPIWSNYNAEQLTIGGVTSGTNAGSYNATFTPNANYRWSDGTTTGKQVAWTIGKAAGSLSISPNSMTLDMDNKTKTITVTRAGDGAITASSSNTAVATVSVSGNIVTVTGNASGSAEITVIVAEGINYTAPASQKCAVTVKFISSILNENSWAVIKSVSDNGEGANYWAVGDKKTITINGTNYQVQIIGFNHDTKTAGGKAGITFQLVDCLNTIYKMNSSDTNVGGWKSSALRSRMSEFLGQLDEDLQSVIKPVNKLVSIGNNTSTIETVSDKLFLLSEVEIFGSTTYSFAGEGSQYDWYKAGNTKVKKVNGSANGWWERSPSSGYTEYLCLVNSNGRADYTNASGRNGVSFGFCV